MAEPNLAIELEQEVDGRWIAELPVIPGVLAYGDSQDEAIARVQVLALRVIADRLEHGESVPQLVCKLVLNPNNSPQLLACHFPLHR
jgi:predicted RNase H-like HicB family nuclease